MFASSRRFHDDFRIASAVALLGWCAQTFLVASITANLFLHPLLFSSTAAIIRTLLVSALAVVVSIVGLAFYVTATIQSILSDT